MKQIVCLGLLLLATSVSAQQRPPQFDMQIKTTRVTQDIYLIEGAGGNVAAYVWDHGVLLVDDKLAPASADVRVAVAAITSKPIRFVINSHWHRDHSGGNEALAGDGSVIVAHENVRKRMSVDGFISIFNRKTTASPPKALPIVTFTSSVTFHLGNEEISVIHVDPAHTDGDSFVYFRKANVLHMGDCYLNGSFPVIDSSNGGSFSGTITAADRALAMINAETQIMPGHGPIARRQDLSEWRTMLRTIFDRVRSAVRSGKNLQQIKAQGVAKEWETRFPKSFVTPDHVVDEAYRSVTNTNQKAHSHIRH